MKALARIPLIRSTFPDPTELDRLKMLADAEGLYSYRPSHLPSLSLLNYLPKGNRKKTQSEDATPGARMPADYGKRYPTLYIAERSDLEAFAEAKAEGKRTCAGGGMLARWAEREATIRARDSRLEIVGTTLNHNLRE